MRFQSFCLFDLQFTDYSSEIVARMSFFFQKNIILSRWRHYFSKKTYHKSTVIYSLDENLFQVFATQNSRSWGTLRNVVGTCSSLSMLNRKSPVFNLFLVYIVETVIKIQPRCRYSTYSGSKIILDKYISGVFTVFPTTVNTELRLWFWNV